jgi:hypothetical protein
MERKYDILFSKAVDNDEIFDYLVGSKGYET